MRTTSERVLACAKEVTGLQELAEESRIREDLGLDSLGVVALVVGIEESLGIAFDDSDLDPGKLTDLRALVALAEAKL